MQILGTNFITPRDGQGSLYLLGLLVILTADKV